MLDIRPFRWWYAPLAILAFLAIQAPIDLLTRPMPTDPVARAAMTAQPFAVFALVALCVPWMLNRRLVWQDYALGPIPFGRAAMFVLIVPVVIGVGVSLIESLSPGLDEAADVVAESFDTGESIWADAILILAITCFAPLAEELAFRGIIYRSLRDGFARWLPLKVTIPVALVASAALFARSHLGEGQQDQFWLLATTAAILVLSYELSGSFLVPVMIHSVNNVIASLVSFVWTDTDVHLASDYLVILIFAGPVLSWLAVRGLRRLIPQG